MQRILQDIMKKKILGRLDAWLMSHSSQLPSILYWRLSDFHWNKMITISKIEIFLTINRQFFFLLWIPEWVHNFNAINSNLISEFFSFFCKVFADTLTLFQWLHWGQITQTTFIYPNLILKFSSGPASFLL